MNILSTALMPLLFTLSSEEITINQAFEKAQDFMHVVETMYSTASEQVLEHLGQEVGIAIKGLFASSSKCSQAVVEEVIKRLLVEVIRPSFTRYALGATTTLNVLPNPLCTLTSKELLRVFYLRLIQQNDGWSCGYWSVFNACALNHILTNGYSLISENIQILTNERVRALLAQVPKQSISEAELIALIHAQDLKDVFIVTVNQENGHEGSLTCTYKGPYNEEEDNKPYSMITFVQDQNEFAEVFNILRERLKQNDTSRAFHFICNLEGYHWILISIVKKVHREPFMIIADSVNFMVPHRGNDRYISFLYKALLARTH